MHPARILEPGTLTWAGARAAGTEGCEHISWAARAPSDGRLATVCAELTSLQWRVAWPGIANMWGIGEDSLRPRWPAPLCQGSAWLAPKPAA